MDSTVIVKILGCLNPRKWLTMFAKWWLKDKRSEDKRQHIIKVKELSIEERRLKFEELEANRKKPNWCFACDIDMVVDEIPAPYAAQIGYRCPKCGLTRYHKK